MAAEPEHESWERIQALVEAEDDEGLKRCLGELSSTEAVRAMFRLDAEMRERVLTTLEPREAADLVEEIPDEHAADIIEQLDVEDAAAILDAMQSDDQADILGEMDASDAEAILARMAPAEAQAARRLLHYSPDVAGGLMINEFLAFRERVTASEVLEELQRLSESEEEFHTREIYVVTDWKRLIGVVTLNRLVTARSSTALADVMSPQPHVAPLTTLDELQAFFERNDAAAVPVINERVRLIGVVTRDAVADALIERAEEERRKMQGIIGGDEIRSMPLLTRTRRRLSWLSINIVLNVAAATVITFYEDTLRAVIALAVFLPIVSDMSGCSGNQAVAVSMRELALGIVKPFEVFRVLLQEVSVGLINGVALGSALGLLAWLWKGDAYLGLVVGIALATNSLLAVLLGGTLPLLLKRVGIDPAVASGPILTTVTDLCGFFLVLSIATAMLSRMESA
jgi:magnesium transporter